MKYLLSIALLVIPAFAQTYQLPPQACVSMTNCIIYGPAESFSLWEEHGPNGQSWEIFNLYSWVNGFSRMDTYHCNISTWLQGAPDSNAPPKSTTEIIGSCADVDSNGNLFEMEFTVYAYSYHSHGGGGRGGGGAGTRWQITGGSVTITTK